VNGPGLLGSALRLWEAFLEYNRVPKIFFSYLSKFLQSLKRVSLEAWSFIQFSHNTVSMSSRSMGVEAPSSFTGSISTKGILSDRNPDPESHLSFG
jgi:hypothetical protein